MDIKNNDKIKNMGVVRGSTVVFGREAAKLSEYLKYF
jgi:hypothetical protein